MSGACIRAKLSGVRALSTILLALALAQPAGAQVFGAPRSTGRSVWVSGGTGWAMGGDLTDGATQSSWTLGQYSPLRAAVEFERRGTAMGLALSHATVPMTYNGPGCTRCDADVDMLQMLGMFRVGGGRPGQGFHQVLEFGGGVTQWSKLTARGPGSIAPMIADNDLTFQIGYGFGVNLGDAFAVTLVQDVATVIHQKDGLSAGQNRSVTQRTTRLGARLRLRR